MNADGVRKKRLFSLKKTDEKEKRYFADERAEDLVKVPSPSGRGKIRSESPLTPTLSPETGERGVPTRSISR